MHRKNILHLLDDYKLKHKNENELADKFIDFINKHENCFERTLLHGHLTGSAWVLNKNKTHVLLTHHKKLNKWLQLGGHADGDSDILNVALREVKEESGLSDLELLNNGIFDIDLHTIPGRKNEPEHFHYDIRFAFRVTGSEEYKVSNESIDLAWVKLNELNKLTNEPSLLRMAQKSI